MGMGRETAHGCHASRPRPSTRSRPSCIFTIRMCRTRGRRGADRHKQKKATTKSTRAARNKYTGLPRVQPKPHASARSDLILIAPFMDHHHGRTPLTPLRLRARGPCARTVHPTATPEHGKYTSSTHNALLCCSFALVGHSSTNKRHSQTTTHHTSYGGGREDAPGRQAAAKEDTTCHAKQMIMIHERSSGRRGANAYCIARRYRLRVTREILVVCSFAPTAQLAAFPFRAERTTRQPPRQSQIAPDTYPRMSPCMA